MRVIILLTLLMSCSAELHYSQKEKIGKLSRTEVKNLKPEWFKNSGKTESLNLFPKSMKIKIFFGTWCHDSKRELPRLISELNKLRYFDEQIEWYSMSRDKKEPSENVKKSRIYFTPTIIFFDNEKEIERFVERPHTDWKNDISKILKLAQRN